MAHRHHIPRPGPIDGLDVIAAYGNRPNIDVMTERVTGRLGQNWIVCADGFTVSVIAGQNFHCWPSPSPFADLQLFPHDPFEHTGPYTCFEVYGPSARPEPWSDWHQFYCGSGREVGDQALYAFVPLKLVRDLLDLHGGFRRFQRIDLRTTAQGELMRWARAKRRRQAREVTA